MPGVLPYLYSTIAGSSVVFGFRLIPKAKIKAVPITAIFPDGQPKAEVETCGHVLLVANPDRKTVYFLGTIDRFVALSIDMWPTRLILLHSRLICCSDDDQITATQRQDCMWRLDRALAATHPGAHGGCTDASVRLSHLLKVK